MDSFKTHVYISFSENNVLSPFPGSASKVQLDLQNLIDKNDLNTTKQEWLQYSFNFVLVVLRECQTF